MRKNQDINRLHTYRSNNGLKKIETYEANKPILANIYWVHDKNHFPDVVAIYFTQPTRTLTIKYIGLTVIWYALSNKARVLQGNEKPKQIEITGGQLYAKMLHQGKKGFM